MKPLKIPELCQEIEGPILILSSRAGLGNSAFAAAFQEKLNNHLENFHYPIEELIPINLIKTDFLRYSFICEKAPWLLNIIYKLPFNYWLKLIKTGMLPKLRLENLSKKINDLKVKTIICFNHRAAFWISCLKKQKQINCRIFCFLTDFSISPGWKYIFINQIDQFWGMIESGQIPWQIKEKYCQTEFLVSEKFYSLSSEKGAKNQVLITGGGWGLGKIAPLIKKLSRELPELTIHVTCGDNKKLYKKFIRNKNLNIKIYKDLVSIFDLMKICRIIITKPGAAALCEAQAAKREIFLLKGLPVIEKANTDFAVKNFKARIFNMRIFKLWYQGLKE